MKKKASKNIKEILCICFFVTTFNVDATIWYVKTTGSGNGSSWANATNNIQTAINSATVGDTIWVALGNYQTGSSITMKNGVAIFGGFNGTEATFNQRNFTANPTIINAGSNGGLSAVSNNGINNTAVLDGFIITNANATGSGGGMYNTNSSPVIRNVVFSNNTCTSFGAGMANTNSSNPTLFNVVFSNNVATQYGGGMSNISSNPVLTNVVFTGCSATQGMGGGMYNVSVTSSTLTNVTFYNNTANNGACMYIQYSEIIANNCILTGDIFYMNSGDVFANYSLVSNNSGGANNVIGTPVFVNASNPAGPDGLFMTADDGLVLKAFSPGINIGSNAYIPNNVTADIAGAPRITNAVVDAGAYESQCIFTFSTSNYTVCASALPYNWNGKTINAAGTLIDTLTNKNGCDSIATLNLTVLPLPTVTLNSGYVCIGSSYTLAPGGAVTYTISGGSNIVTPTTTTSYTVMGTDANGCTNNAVASIQIASLPSVIMFSGSVCTGSTFTLEARHASTYTLSNGVPMIGDYNGAFAVVTPTVQTSYTVTGTDGNGCVNKAVATVTVNQLPIVSIYTTKDTLCVGESTMLTASGANNYYWSSNQSGASVHVYPTVTTTYTLTGKDGNNCTNTATLSVKVNPLPTIIISVPTGTLCVGDATTLVAVGANTYSWSTNNTGTTFSVSPTFFVHPNFATTYTVFATDSNGCINKATINASTCVSGIESFMKLTGSLVIYPNPNLGLFTINLDEDAQVIVSNALGEVVLTELSKAGARNFTIENRLNGVYFVRVITPNSQQTSKLIKN